MNKFKLLTLFLIFLTGMSQQLLAQKTIVLNGEKIRVKEFTVYGSKKSLNRIGYKKKDNLTPSPFFGQENPIKFEGNSKCEIGYSILGYLSPEAQLGKYIVDYKTPGEFLPLYSTSKSEDSWDNLIFDYFSSHTDGISQEFLSLWNSEKYSTNKAKRELLLLPTSKQTRETFYNKFLDEVSTATYTKKTKKEVEIAVKLEARIEADLNEYLKTQNVTDSTANIIRSETKVNINRKLNSSNLIEIKYFNLRFNGTFLGLVKDYAKIICNKNSNKLKLTEFEKEFYDEYMIKDNVFLISNLQYISYKIDKTKITNLITEITQDINASLAKNQIKGLDPGFSANVTVKINKEISEEFKSEGGYVLQIAESGQFGQINADCK